MNPKTVSSLIVVINLLNRFFPFFSPYYFIFISFCALGLDKFSTSKSLTFPAVGEQESGNWRKGQLHNSGHCKWTPPSRLCCSYYFSSFYSFIIHLLYCREFSVGSAPILKQKKFKVDSSKTIDFLSSTLKRLLKLGENDSLFLYVNQAFAPSLDSVLQQLHDCYSIDGKLMIHYCTTQAWG